jgi:sec-independent protein translocase protein TatC
MSDEMSVLDHLKELRKRLLYAILWTAIGSSVGLYYAVELIGFLSVPFGDNFSSGQLIGTGPAEAFFIKLAVGVFGGMVLASPLIFHQFWLFVAPALYEAERKLALPFLICSLGLLLLGLWFCYSIVLPVSLSFFAEQYGDIGLTPQIKLSEYLGIAIRFLVIFGIIFELPIVAFFLARAGLITAAFLINHGRIAILLIFVLAAVLTPPDVISQLLLAGPLLVLYGVSIGVVKLSERKDGI